MTIYQKKFNEIIKNNFDGYSTPQILEVMFEMGVIENTILKVLVIREFVKKLVVGGESKITAMWKATEIFACSFEYVRKCMYYYKDVNLVSKNV